jgi:selenocysteine lyase/cysteine desulfurase
MGRKASIPVVVDGAHAFAQFPIDRKDLGCDFYGASLHKWLMAPMGTGLLFIAKPKIEQIWPLMAAPPESNDNIRKFEEIGTHPAAPHNAIAEAIEFHELIGAERKFARLLYLRDRWSSPLRENKKFKFHSPMGSDRCVLTTVEIEGLEHDKLAGWLLDKKGIVVTGIAHPLFKGIRVTPSVYTTLGELDRFSEAMLEAATKGI